MVSGALWDRSMTPAGSENARGWFAGMIVIQANHCPFYAALIFDDGRWSGISFSVQYLELGDFEQCPFFIDVGDPAEEFVHVRLTADFPAIGAGFFVTHSYTGGIGIFRAGNAIGGFIFRIVAISCIDRCTERHEQHLL